MQLWKRPPATVSTTTGVLDLEDVRRIVRRYAGAELASRGVQDIALYRLALTHRSCHSSLNGERLEFLGDAVLGAVAAQYLYQRYRDQDEGFLSRMRSQLVCGAALARLCARIPAMATSIRVATPVDRGSPDVMEDALEAFVGALFTDAGGFEVARAWVVGMFEAEVDFSAAVIESCRGRA